MWPGIPKSEQWPKGIPHTAGLQKILIFQVPFIKSQLHLLSICNSSSCSQNGIVSSSLKWDESLNANNEDDGWCDSACIARCWSASKTPPLGLLELLPWTRKPYEREAHRSNWCELKDCELTFQPLLWLRCSVRFWWSNIWFLEKIKCNIELALLSWHSLSHSLVTLPCKDMVSSWSLAYPANIFPFPKHYYKFIPAYKQRSVEEKIYTWSFDTMQ